MDGRAIQPQRIQLSRRKGFNLQAASKALNGLDALKCARPSKWGNPFIVGAHGNHQQCVDMFRACMVAVIEKRRDVLVWPEIKRMASMVRVIAGKNLACFCPLDQPCHCDVLIELANRRVQSAAEHK